MNHRSKFWCCPKLFVYFDKRSGGLPKQAGGFSLSDRAGTAPFNALPIVFWGLPMPVWAFL
jgi:hypothetical protein